MTIKKIIYAFILAGILTLITKKFGSESYLGFLGVLLITETVFNFLVTIIIYRKVYLSVLNVHLRYAYVIDEYMGNIFDENVVKDPKKLDEIGSILKAYFEPGSGYLMDTSIFPIVEKYDKFLAVGKEYLRVAPLGIHISLIRDPKINRLIEIRGDNKRFIQKLEKTEKRLKTFDKILDFLKIKAFKIYE